MITSSFPIRRTSFRPALSGPYSTAQQLRIAERLRPEIWEEILACGVLCTGRGEVTGPR